MKYEVLSQKNEAYLGKVWDELDLLYRGGYDLECSEAKAELLPRVADEQPDAYRDRVRDAQYINYLAQIVDFFGAAVFQRPVSVGPSPDKDSRTPDEDVYTLFAEDTNGRGEDFQTILKKSITTALVFRRALVAVDFPTAPLDEDGKPIEVTSRKAEQELGLDRPVAFTIDPREMIDWDYADDGSFNWCVLHRRFTERKSLADSYSEVVEQFKHWFRDETGKVRWELYELRRSAKAKGAVRGGTDVPLIAEGSVSFKRVPIVELELPHGLWVGNKLGGLAKEHFQRRSKLTAAIKRSIFAIPYVGLASEIKGMGEEIPSEVQQNPLRGHELRTQLERRGWFTIGAEDKIGFAEPTGSGFELEAQQLKDIVDEMFRIGHQMAMSIANTSKALARSGLSKTEDRHAIEIVLKAYGKLVKLLAVRIFDTISKARGEDVYWTAYGADKFEIWDREQIVSEAQTVGEIAIPSPTFSREYFGKMAERLLDDANPQTLQEIREEIKGSVERESKAVHAALDHMSDLDAEDDDDADEDAEPGSGTDRSGARAERGGDAPEAPGRNGRRVVARRKTSPR